MSLTTSSTPPRSDRIQGELGFGFPNGKGPFGIRRPLINFARFRVRCTCFLITFLLFTRGFFFASRPSVACVVPSPVASLGAFNLEFTFCLVAGGGGWPLELVRAKSSVPLNRLGEPAKECFAGVASNSQPWEDSAQLMRPFARSAPAHVEQIQTPLPWTCFGRQPSFNMARRSRSDEDTRFTIRQRRHSPHGTSNDGSLDLAFGVLKLTPLGIRTARISRGRVSCNQEYLPRLGGMTCGRPVGPQLSRTRWVVVRLSAAPRAGRGPKLPAAGGSFHVDGFPARALRSKVPVPFIGVGRPITAMGAPVIAQGAPIVGAPCAAAGAPISTAGAPIPTTGPGTTTPDAPATTSNSCAQPAPSPLAKEAAAGTGAITILRCGWARSSPTREAAGRCSVTPRVGVGAHPASPPRGDAFHVGAPLAARSV